MSFEEKVDSAVHAAMWALGLSVESYPKLADALNDFISVEARHIVTDDNETDIELDGMGNPLDGGPL